MTAIQVAATLSSTILIKGSIVCLLVLLAGKCARSASGASLVLGLGPVALGLVMLLGSLLPQLSPGFVSIRHEAIQGVGGIRLTPAELFVAAWMIVAVILLVRVFRDLMAVKALVRRADMRRESGHLVHGAAKAVGCTRIPEIRETAELQTAALIGVLKPVLLIPRQARHWSEEELFGVLCHEMEHARRNDWLMLMLERIVGAIFWINPLVHLVRRRAIVAREVAADDAALRAGTAAATYAGRLIAVARDLKSAPRLAVSVAFASRGDVAARVRALFEARDRREVSAPSILRAAVIAIPLILVLSAVEPWSCLPGTPADSAATACP